jgi:hypothetical protein
MRTKIHQQTAPFVFRGGESNRHQLRKKMRGKKKKQINASI